MYQYGFPWFYAGNLFRDPVYRKQAFLKLGNRDRFFYTELTLTPVQLMIFDDDSVGEADYEDSYPLVKHYSDPFGVTMARTGYNVGPDSADVMALMELVERTVMEKFGVKLRPEVRLLGETL